MKQVQLKNISNGEDIYPIMPNNGNTGEAYDDSELRSKISEIEDSIKAVTLESNQILYTTTDNKKITLNTSPTFWDSVTVDFSKVKSHEYSEFKGYGLITIDGDTVPSFLLFGQDTLESVRIGGGLKTIGGNSFAENKNLKSVIIDDGVEIISKCKNWDGNYAHEGMSFRSNPLLRYIDIPDSVYQIGLSAFASCTGLLSIKFPKNDKLTEICEEAFIECSSISTLIIPDSVVSIGECAFESCTSLTSVIFGEKLTTLGTSCFGHDVNLTRISENKITQYGSNVFYNTSVKEYKFHDGLTNINKWPFSYSTLDVLTVPASVTTVEATPWEFYPRKIDYSSNFSNPYRWPHPSRLEELILRDNSVITGLETWLFENPWSNTDGQKLFPYNNVPLTKLKIYVPESLIERYKTTYPKLKNKFFPINGEQTVYAYKEDLEDIEINHPINLLEQTSATQSSVITIKNLKPGDVVTMYCENVSVYPSSSNNSVILGNLTANLFSFKEGKDQFDTKTLEESHFDDSGNVVLQVKKSTSSIAVGLPNTDKINLDNITLVKGNKPLFYKDIPATKGELENYVKTSDIASTSKSGVMSVELYNELKSATAEIESLKQELAELKSKLVFYTVE